MSVINSRGVSLVKYSSTEGARRSCIESQGGAQTSPATIKNQSEKGAHCSVLLGNRAHMLSIVKDSLFCSPCLGNASDSSR